MKEIDWEKVKEWDKKYILRTYATQSEYNPLFVESTRGDYLITPDGTKYLDFFNQLYCVNAGQNVEKINNAIKEAMERYTFVWDAFPTDYKAKAAKLIMEDILGKEKWPGKIRFLSSGSEAVEVALIMARLYTNKPLVMTREYSYHGFSRGAVSVTRLRGTKSGLTGTTNDSIPQAVPTYNTEAVAVIPSPNCFRCSLNHKYETCKDENGQLACVKYTKRMIENYGSENVAGLITEIVQGAGSVQPPEEYIQQIRQLTREMNIVWIVDEILTGFGRMGSWFAYQKYGVEPDIITTAKGISSSYIPCGAVIVSKEIAEFFDRHRWEHVSTFSGHPLAMAAVCANIEYMMEENLIEKSKAAGEYIKEKLTTLQKKHKTIGKFSGEGTLWLVELVKDEKMTPFIESDRNHTHELDPNTFPVNIIRSKAFEKGVLMGGYMPNTLRMAPSLAISREDIDKAMDALDYGLTYLDSLIK